MAIKKRIEIKLYGETSRSKKHVLKEIETALSFAGYTPKVCTTRNTIIIYAEEQTH